MRIARPLCAGLVTLVATSALTGCLGDRQAQADRIIDAAKRTESTGTFTGRLDASVVPLKAPKGATSSAPPIAKASVDGVAFRADAAKGLAALGGTDGTPAQVFDRSVVWQHRVAGAVAPTDPAAIAELAKAAEAAQAEKAAAPAGPSVPPTPSNLGALAAEAMGKPLAGRSAARPWVKLDYDALDRPVSTKSAGSLALSPVTLVRLLRGTLAGSIDEVGTDAAGTTHYRLRFSRDKAERGLSNDDRILLEKQLEAHAASPDIANGEAWVDKDGALVAASITLRQTIDRATRADLRAHLSIEAVGTPVTVELPAKREVSVVPSLGALVLAVVPT